MPKQVTHLINGLGLGGAETMLYRILKYRSNLETEQMVVSLGESHFYENKIRDLGVHVIEVPFRKSTLASVIKLVKILKNTGTLCCWLYHSNLIGFLVGKIAGVKRIVWCIRHSSIARENNSMTTLMINRVCAKLSRYVDVITYNGSRARQVHESLGYAKKKGVVLFNGVDCKQYAPSSKARDIIIQELGIEKEKKIILSVTKNHPIKDVPCFIKAFAYLCEKNLNVVAVMCGAGIVPDNEELDGLCKQNGLRIGKDIFLLGVRNDISTLMAGCDLYVLHSAGEAFPNTLIQAMACGCLCISTDVGDVRNILEDEEMILPPGEPRLLAEKIYWGVQLSKYRIKRKIRQYREKVKNNYDIHEIVKKYEMILHN